MTGPRARPDCKVDGCGRDRYVFPYGGRSTYCREHLRLRNTKQRNGLARMTGQMKAVLQFLRDQRDGDAYLFVEIAYPLAHGKTLLKLLDDDRILWSQSALDGTTKYRITGRGLKDFAVYEPRRARMDGLCPGCGLKPRRVYATGRRAAYCEDCDRKLTRRKTARLRRQPTAALCPRCKTRPRYRYPGGTYSAYCEHCARVAHRQNRRKRQRQLFKLITAGGPVPLCKRCKSAPRIVYPHCVADYCRPCKLEVEGQARIRRRAARLAVLQ